ncbi:MULTISPECIES: hypothetical protein [Streptomyces]|uniref:Uncharacterized protein n=1 Tax=Streptomyces solicathayae TaxID=3081768 RepID=A0ABZ0LPV1_9ACTN|nr:hypothetical protein [Streptomyces sp. HUAS YS2]WOX21513.1 hypothetical protein R2D22_08935 [Streptomyces sp. HUAS YS2]
MARGSGRRTRAGRPAGDAHSGAAGPLVLVVATPADAIPLLSAEPPGAPIAVTCLDRGAAGELEALGRALAVARDHGHRIMGEPYVVDARGDEVEDLLFDEFLDIGPTRIGTLDPDPVSTAVEGGERKFAVVEPPARGRAARAALRAARAYQEYTGKPVFVDCRRAGTDPRAPFEAASRYPRQSNWLTLGRDGRLSVHLLSAAGVLRWTESVPGGPGWDGPELLETPELMPGLTVLQGADGYVRLFGLRRAERQDGGELEVVTAVQYQSGRPLGPWNPVGNPNAREWERARQVGFPVAALDAAGTLHVFVRNIGRSISTRRQDTAGRWTAWEHLRGRRVADEMAVFPGWDGGVELVARRRDSVEAVHWHFDPASRSWTENRTIPVSAVPGSIAAAPEAAAVRFRYAATNELCVWQPGAHAPISLGGADGSGPVTGVAGAGIQGWSCTVMARPGRDGVPAVGAHADGRPDTGVWWSPTGERSLVAPAVALDGLGRVAVATLGSDGVPRIARQREDVAGLEFGPWQAI